MEGAKRGGVSTGSMLGEYGISPRLLEDPEARVDKSILIKLMLEIMRQTQDEFMGFGSGRVSKPGTFSMMAHALINCATLEKAIKRGIQFYELFDYDIKGQLVRQDGETVIRYHCGANMAFRSNIMEAVIFLSLRFMGWLIGQEIVPWSINLDFDAGDDGELYAGHLPCQVRYNQDKIEILLDTRYLDMPLVQTPLSLSKFLKGSLLELMDGDIKNASMNAQIRSIISKEFGNNFPDFTVICQKLNMTPQTLRRRLKEESTSYQEIKDSIRKDASIYYLSKQELTIDEIAMLMGFSEASSFHRAFKKWTNKTPSSFRQSLAVKEECGSC